jgi:plasmid maintenance system antidote protein VapI
VPDDGAVSEPDRTVADFGRRLKELTAHAGFSVRELARAVDLPRSTVSDALGGKRLARQETVLAIVRACGGDEAEWRSAWAQVQLARAGSPPSTGPQPAVAPPASSKKRVWLVVTAVAMAVGVGFVVARMSDDPADAPCRPARRYDVVQGGNLLAADRTILVATQPGDVFYATQLDATPYTSRHYGNLVRTGQWGYVDAQKLAHGAPACLPASASPP